MTQEPIWASGVPKLGLLFISGSLVGVSGEISRQRIMMCNMSIPMFSRRLNSLVLFLKVKNHPFLNRKLIGHLNSVLQFSVLWHFEGRFAP